jgi:hypothetical protein
MKTMLCVCLGILALSAPASAQQEECFAVAMTNATGGGSLGSILFNKCTGNTWLLIRTQTPDGATANRWFPISVEKSEAITSNPPSPR